MAQAPARLDHRGAPIPPSFALVLEPAEAAARRIGGLSLALRLALDAQAAGAGCIVVPEAASDLRALLVDARLRLPVVSEPPTGAPRLRAAASLLVHRATLRELSEKLRAGSEPRDTKGAGPGDTKGAGPEPHNTKEAALGDTKGAGPGDTKGAGPGPRDTRKETELAIASEATRPPRVPYSFAPIDVTSAAAEAKAERALFRSLRKPQDGWTSRYLNRYISLFISRLLIKTPLKPNQVSVAILGVGVGGALLAAQGSYATLAAGAALFQAQSVLDGCDGELSRVSHRGSRLGEWLDTIGDDLTNYGFFGGAGLGLYHATGLELYLLAGSICVACGVVSSGLEYRYLIKIGSGDLLKYPLSQASSGRGKLAIIAPLFKRDTFVLLTLLSALADVLGPMLCVFALAAIGILISVLKTELRLMRQGRARAG